MRRRDHEKTEKEKRIKKRMELREKNRLGQLKEEIVANVLTPAVQ